MARQCLCVQRNIMNGGVMLLRFLQTLTTSPAAAVIYNVAGLRTGGRVTAFMNLTVPSNLFLLLPEVGL